MKEFNKIKVKPGTLMYPLPVVMVTAGSVTDSNIITIGWTGIINTEPPILYISVRKSRHSHEMIVEAGSFVINLTNEELTKAADYSGVRSGRDVKKAAELGLTMIPAETVSAPMIAESPVNLECRVIEVREFPTHDMFTAEVVAAHISAEYIDESGAFDFGRMNLVAYNHGGYYALDDDDMGRFGFSVMKEKTKRRKEKEERGARRQALRSGIGLGNNKKNRDGEERGYELNKRKYKNTRYKSREEDDMYSRRRIDEDSRSFKSRSKRGKSADERRSGYGDKRRGDFKDSYRDGARDKDRRNYGVSSRRRIDEDSRGFKSRSERGKSAEERRIGYGDKRRRNHGDEPTGSFRNRKNWNYGDTVVIDERRRSEKTEKPPRMSYYKRGDRK